MSEKIEKTEKRKVSFAVNTSEMPSEVQTLPNGRSWAAELCYVGISEKAPLALEKERLWDETSKTFKEGSGFVLNAPFGFSYGATLLSKEAQKLLGRDAPKVFGGKGGTISLRFNSSDSSEPFKWQGSTSLRELLINTGLDSVDYGKEVSDTWEDSIEELYDILKISEEQKEVYKNLDEDTLLNGLNAVLYYTTFFKTIAQDLDGVKVKVVIARKPSATNKERMENVIDFGSRFNPYSGTLKYVEGCENDLDS